jgi:hypothetical protein
MTYLALSKKVESKIRIAALIALGVMILSVIVCVILIFFGGVSVAAGPVVPEAEILEKAPVPGPNLVVIFGIIFFLIALFVVIAVLSIRERRRAKAAS